MIEIMLFYDIVIRIHKYYFNRFPFAVELYLLILLCIGTCDRVPRNDAIDLY